MANFQIKQWHDFNFSVIHPCSLNQVLTTNLNTVLEKNSFGETEKSTDWDINSGSELKRREEQPQAECRMACIKAEKDSVLALPCITNGLTAKSGKKKTLPRTSSVLDNTACYRDKATMHNQTKGCNL